MWWVTPRGKPIGQQILVTTKVEWNQRYKACSSNFFRSGWVLLQLPDFSTWVQICFWVTWKLKASFVCISAKTWIHSFWQTKPQHFKVKRYWYLCLSETIDTWKWALCWKSNLFAKSDPTNIVANECGKVFHSCPAAGRQNKTLHGSLCYVCAVACILASSWRPREWSQHWCTVFPRVGGDRSCFFPVSRHARLTIGVSENGKLKKTQAWNSGLIVCWTSRRRAQYLVKIRQPPLVVDSGKNAPGTSFSRRVNRKCAPREWDARDARKNDLNYTGSWPSAMFRNSDSVSSHSCQLEPAGVKIGMFSNEWFTLVFVCCGQT